MTLPMWLIQEAYEEHIAQEKDFQEWCDAIEMDMAQEFYVRPRPKQIRSKRYLDRKNK